MTPVVCLLTTRDRPAFLRRSLPSIHAQSQRLGIPLLVVDDGSSDPETLELLEPLRAQVWHHRPNADRHRSVGEAFLFGLEQVFRLFGARGALLKVDDDVLLTDDCFEQMIEAWGWAWHSPGATQPAALSALMTSTTAVLSTPRAGVHVTDLAAPPCALWRLDLWAWCIAELGREHIVEHGWDNSFSMHWLNRRRDGHCYTLAPSRAYHADHTGGVHTRRDVNRYDAMGFVGPLEVRP